MFISTILSILPNQWLYGFNWTCYNKQAMRLWSIHPKYLDAKGLVALWREGLLAQACLAGNTKGYTNHPQLDRFKKLENPIHAISTYLHAVANEASNRPYNFNTSKILEPSAPCKISVTTGQIDYEWQHFLRKVQIRDPFLHQKSKAIKRPSQHPIFDLVEGEIENWEKV